MGTALAVGASAVIATSSIAVSTSEFRGGPIGRDSGVFLYIGWRMLEGDLPYRDVWDHKGPLLYYVNALGVAINERVHPSGFGVLQLLLLVAATVLVALILAVRAGIHVSVTTFVLGALYLSARLEGGNIPEAYGVLVDAVCVACLYWLLHRRTEVGDGGGPAAVVLGAGVAASFLIRPNLVVTPFVCAVATVIATRSPRITSRIAVGAVAMTGLLLAPVIPGGTAELWDQIWRYNASYSAHAGLGDRLRSGSALASSAFSGLVVGVLTSATTVALVRRASRREGAMWGPARARTPLDAVGGAAMVFSVLSVLLSGRPYDHYLLQLTVPLMMVMAACLDRIDTFRSPVRIAGLGCIVLLVAPALASDATRITSSVTDIRQTADLAITERIIRATEPGDQVLVWGAEAKFNYMARRPSPTRYVYQLPLVVPPTPTCGRTDEFIDEMISRPPDMLIDTRNPSLPSIDGAWGDGPATCGLGPWIRRFVADRYERLDVDDPYGFVYYVREVTGQATAARIANDTASSHRPRDVGT